MSYLPDDILCKVDRAAMAISLETRVPFWIIRVAGLAAAAAEHEDRSSRQMGPAPSAMHVPRELIRRPKARLCAAGGPMAARPTARMGKALLGQLRLPGS